MPADAGHWTAGNRFDEESSNSEEPGPTKRATSDAVNFGYRGAGGKALEEVPVDEQISEQSVCPYDVLLLLVVENTLAV